MENNKKTTMHNTVLVGDKKVINNEYYTPKWVFEFLVKDNNISKIDLDAATNDFNMDRLDSFINHGFSKEDNGLEQDWSEYESVWINPPFSLKKDFYEKAKQEINKEGSKIKHLFFLTPDKSITNNFFDFIEEGWNMYIPKGRISFVNGGGELTSNNHFGSVILHYNRETSVKGQSRNKSMTRPSKEDQQDIEYSAL